MAVKVEAYRVLMGAVAPRDILQEAAAEAVGGRAGLYQAAPLRKE